MIAVGISIEGQGEEKGDKSQFTGFLHALQESSQYPKQHRLVTEMLDRIYVIKLLAETKASGFLLVQWHC